MAMGHPRYASNSGSGNSLFEINEIGQWALNSPLSTFYFYRKLSLNLSKSFV